MSSQRGFRRGRRTVTMVVAALAAATVAPLAVTQAAGAGDAAPTTSPGAVLVEDTYVVDFAKSSTRGNRSYLRVGAGAVAYLKFQVTDMPSDPHAVLWLHSLTQSQTKISAYQAASSDWSATDLTWKNQPGSTGSSLSTVTGTTPDTWTAIDLPGLISAPGTYSIVLRGVNDAVKFDSQESTAPPLLDLGYTTPPTGSTTTATSTLTTATPAPTPTSPSTTSTASSTPPTTTTTTTSTSTSPPSATGDDKVLVIVDENHTQAQAQASMPYLVSLQNTFGVTTNHTATTHPSLPNYLEIAGGSTFGVTDDAAPSSHPVSGVSVFGAAQAQGRSARTYNESMTTGCQQTSSGQYAVKHNPWAYFVDERTACRTDDVPLTDLPGDITAGALPTVGMITPNLCNDGHDCSLTTADAFLETWVPQIMNGPDYRTGHLSIVITFDEGVGTDQTIQTVVVNPALQAKVVTTPLTHAGLSRWLYRVSGSTPQNDAATAIDFGAAFGL